MLRSVEENKQKIWFKLDNAAKIYPAANTRRWSGMFRMSITFNETVDPRMLQQALEKVILRFPSFNIRMRRGIFWYYFEENVKRKPVVKPDINNPCTPIRWKENYGFLLRVFFYDKRIAVDYFHSLTDGTGAMVFLKTLAAEYLRIKGYDISYGNGVLDVSETPDSEELEDSFSKFADSKFKGRIKEARAYKMPGTKLAYNDISIITGSISLEKMKKLAKDANTTITEYLAGLLLYSFYKQKEKTGLYRRPGRLAISIPLNLRNYFPSKTNRNFSLYLNPFIDTMMGEYTLDEIIIQIQHYMRANLNKKTLNAIMTQNVKAEKNMLVRIAPLFIKNFIMKIAHNIYSGRPITTTISNMGIVTMPENMKKHISAVGVILGVSKKNTPNVAVVSYADTLAVSFTSRIEETEIERFFFTHLIKQGIPVKIESNRE